MHTPSTRILSALAYDRGEEYDPGLPPSSALVEALSLVEHATAVVGGPRTNAPSKTPESAVVETRSPTGSRPRI